MFDRGYRSHYMGGQKEKFTRELASEKTWIFKWLQKSQGFQYSCTFYRLQEMDSTVSSMTYASSRTNKYAFNLKGLARTARSHDPSKYVRRGIEKGSEGLKTVGESVISEIIKAVVPTDLKVSGSCIFDPQDKSLQFWNRMFIISCILSVSIDPLFLYLPYANKNSNCIGIDENLAKTATTLRTIIDAFYLIRMVLQFRTAHIAPSSRVFGRGELVTDLSQIARRYLRRYFFVDLLAVLPLPQLVVWKHFHKTKNAEVYATKQALLILVILQYIPRFLRFIPLTSEVKKSAGVFAESALAGAAYYLLWYLLASHIVGAFWYLLAIERHDTCWMDACRSEPDKCKDEFLYCGKKHATGYEAWKKVSKDVLYKQCSIDDDEKDPPFNFGIYENVLKSGTISSNDFFSKFCYCLWWGLQNLSTLGQGLESSVYPGEVLFCIAVCIMGLILLAMLIGNMQTYLQSITVRLEEMRIKRRDSEQWMHHRYLPQELRERVRRYDQYKWLETRGVDEESLVQSLPKDLRRDIKRHLCLNLVRRVPLFANMDERLLDAICERLKPSLSTEGTYILREGDPVDKMLFTIRGSLESVTTDGGRSGFFNRGLLKDGDFCGEELLTWALDPKASSNLPLSTRTVRAMTEVEAFALEAEELKFVASQFRRLHSRQVQHTFRFYSQQWRTWAACFIQAAWRRHAKRKHLEFRFREEKEDEVDGENVGLLNRNDSVGLGNSSSKFGATIFASRFAAHALRGVQRFRTSGRAGNLVNLQKPPEPDFSADH